MLVNPGQEVNLMQLTDGVKLFEGYLAAADSPGGSNVPVAVT